MKFNLHYKAALFVLPLIISGCSSGILETVRKVTYPPDFNYISKDKLQGTMQQFAWYTTLLDNNLRDPASVTVEQRLNSISILNKMEGLSKNLATESLSSNHTIVSFNIDHFRDRIINARTGLEQDPPNYYLVGTVSAYCINCHSLGDNSIKR